MLLCGYNSIQLKKPIRHEKRCYVLNADSGRYADALMSESATDAQTASIPSRPGGAGASPVVRAGASPVVRRRRRSWCARSSRGLVRYGRNCSVRIFSGFLVSVASRGGRAGTAGAAGPRRDGADGDRRCRWLAHERYSAAV